MTGIVIEKKIYKIDSGLAPLSSFFADALFPKFLKPGIVGEESISILDESMNQEDSIDHNESFYQCPRRLGKQHNNDETDKQDCSADFTGH